MPYTNGASVASKNKKKKKNKGGKQGPSQSTGSAPHNTEDYAYHHSDSQIPVEAAQYQQDIANAMTRFDDSGSRMAEPPMSELVDDEDDYYSDQEGPYDDEGPYSPPPQHEQPAPPTTSGKKKKKKKKKGGNGDQNGANGNSGQVTHHRKNKDRIWNTSTQEERERIKEFWLSLGEEERKSLVKVEKEAVLRKMKEQQKHSCSCSVCGRKRNAIEEELEVLYDAYYEELEQYANSQQTGRLLPHPAMSYAPQITHQPPRLGIPPPRHDHHDRVEELDDDEDYDDDDDYEDEEGSVLDHNGLEHAPPLQPNDPRPDFFNFGNSLTVQGGILTVADDLLKNDGKKFIEMMEQLAERRMQREEEANAAANGHDPMPLAMRQAHAAHSHGPEQYDDDEDYDDEEEDDEYDEEEEEEEGPDTMTEEQRMEEGRRMFQIFAARMFEQRVLTAYREKVARERQQKLLEELEEESRRKHEQEELRAKNKDRKKERKRQQRQAKEEERLRKEAEKAAEEAKLKEIEAQKAEEQRKRKEEQRLKREAERKAAEEERKRKEEERKKRLEEEREREAEKERKRKEHAERERKKKEEAARKAKEEKEQREKEAKLRKEREEKERQEKEAQLQKEAAERERARIEEVNKAKQEDANRRALAAMELAAATRAQIPPSGPAGFSQPHSSYNSPHLPVVSPAIPKAGPIGSRPRQASQQDGVPMSIGSPPRTPSIGTRIASTTSPSTPIMHQGSLGQINIPKHAPGFPPVTNVTPTSPLPPHIAPPPGVPPPQGIFGGGMPMNGDMSFLGHRPSLPPGMPLGFSPGPFGPPQYRGFPPANGIPLMPPPPGMQAQIGTPTRPFMDIPQRLPPGVPIAPPSPFMANANPIPMSGHHRQPSGGSHEPIHRPTPIQRPSSTAAKSHGEENDEVDEISKVMGSRALLGDDVDPLPENISPSRRSSVAQFAPSPLRHIPISSPVYGGDAFGDASWSNPRPLGSLSGSLPSAWQNNGAGWSDMDAARSNFIRRRPGRFDQIRAIACEKCNELSGQHKQFVELSTLERAVALAAPELNLTTAELTAVLDIEGDAQNGGGTFKRSQDASGRNLVHWEEEQNGNGHGSPFGFGEVGSPGGLGFSRGAWGPQGPPPIGFSRMASSPAAAGFSSG